MSSDKHCCVPGCKDSGHMHPVLHGFPNPEKERERFNTWLYAIRNHVILGLENKHIYKYRRVCHSHFEDKYRCRNNKISNIAVPTLNLPGILSKKKYVHKNPMHQIENLANPSTSSGILSQKRCVQVNTNPLHQIENLVEPSSSSDVLMYKHNFPASYCTQSTTMEQTLGDRRVVRKPTKKIFLNKAEEEMRKKIVLARIKICKLKNKLKKQSAHIKAAKKLATNPAVLDTLENCSSTAKLVMQMQLRENKKNAKGRRFTLQEKIAALSIYKQSPKGYRFFRKIFILPAQQTLSKLIQMANIKPGINNNIFKQLKTKADSMTMEEKLCTLLFDEVSLKAGITFEERKDQITGLVDNGDQRKAEYADHAQVFMVRGLIHNYKQAVCYTFSASATKGPELAKQIKEVIKSIQEAGLIVVASVCDQGSNNRQALKLLLNETRGTYLRRNEIPKENVILVNDQEIIPLYDPPHLLKGIRNNLITKDLKYTSKEGEIKIAKWSHLQLLLKENPGYKGIRLIPKLTENHVNPEKLNKMKVKLASQIFSRTVASNMGYLADKGILPAECQDTADFLLEMDEIFDSVNGSRVKNRHAKPLLGPATPNSIHHDTWKEAIKLFKNMTFVTSSGKKETVPTIENWVWTLNGIQILLKKLITDFGVSSVWMRHLNQDPLENFFGAVRSHGCRNTNPTCSQFESAFATLLINNISSVHTRGKNCEGDFCIALHNLIINENTEASSTCTFDLESIIDFNFTPLETKENDPRIYAPIQYMSGYFLNKSKSRVFKTCQKCLFDLASKNEVEYIKYREYAGRRWLCTPSNNLVQIVSNMQDIINEMIKTNIDKNYLKERIKVAIMILVDFNFVTCNIHRNKLIDYLVNLVIRCLLFNYCKIINQILAGRRQVDDDEDSMQMKAKKLNRCFKRHK